MIEKAARAMIHAQHRFYNGDASEALVWTSLGSDVREAAIAQARAVLMAVRDITWNEADRIAEPLSDNCPYNPSPDMFFAAVIDAILAQSEDPS